MKQSDDDAKKIVVEVNADLSDLIPGYLERREKDIDTIQKALAEGDFKTIRVIGHDMRGTGMAYGFEMITGIGRTMEKAALEKDENVIQKEVGNLIAYLGALEIVEVED